MSKYICKLHPEAGFFRAHRSCPIRSGEALHCKECKRLLVWCKYPRDPKVDDRLSLVKARLIKYGFSEGEAANVMLFSTPHMLSDEDEKAWVLWETPTPRPAYVVGSCYRRPCEHLHN
jgi:hypothetical protein